MDKKWDKHIVYALLTAVYAAGLLAGSTVSHMPPEMWSMLKDRAYGFAVTGSADGWATILLRSMLFNALPITAAFLMGFTAFGGFGAAVVTFVKGYGAGGAVATLYAAYPGGGLALAALCMLPQALISSLAVITLSDKAIRFSRSFRSIAAGDAVYADTERAAGRKRRFITRFMRVLLTVPVVAVLDAFLTPVILKMVT